MAQFYKLHVVGLCLFYLQADYSTRFYGLLSSGACPAYLFCQSRVNDKVYVVKMRSDHTFIYSCCGFLRNKTSDPREDTNF